MPYVQVPKDLAKIKTKVAFNLTKRQIICFSIAFVSLLNSFKGFLDSVKGYSGLTGCTSGIFSDKTQHRKHWGNASAYSGCHALFPPCYV